MHHIWISMYVFFNLRFPWCREHFNLQWVLCRLSLMNRLTENLIIVSTVVHLSSCLAEKAWIIIIGEVVLGFTDAVFISSNGCFPGCYLIVCNLSLLNCVLLCCFSLQTVMKSTRRQLEKELLELLEDITRLEDLPSYGLLTR